MKYFILCTWFALLSCGPQSGPHLSYETPVRGASTVSYEADVRPIFANYCSACHPSRSGPDWLDYDQAKAYASNGKLMRRAVIEKSMPPPGSPQAAAISDKDRALIGKWVTAGAIQVTAKVHTGEPPIVYVSPAVQQCLQCHGTKRSQGGSRTKLPRLAGQGAEYMIDQLTRFKWRERIDPTDTMNDIAAGLDAGQIADVANYFAHEQSLPSESTKPEGPEEAKAFSRGEARALQECVSCHMNPEYGGRSSDKLIPVLAGQSKQYLINQLLYFQADERRSPSMREFVRGFSHEDIEDLATYFAFSH